MRGNETQNLFKFAIWNFYKPRPPYTLNISNHTHKCTSSSQFTSNTSSIGKRIARRAEIIRKWHNFPGSEIWC